MTNFIYQKCTDSNFKANSLVDLSLAGAIKLGEQDTGFTEFKKIYSISFKRLDVVWTYEKKEERDMDFKRILEKVCK